MASRQAPSDTFDAQCDDCGGEQPHDVSIELRTESDDDENAEFSREPYRISKCRICGAVSHTRMNDA